MKTKAIRTIMLTLLIASMLSMAFNVATVFAKTIAIDGDPSDWDGIDPIITDLDDYLYNQFDIKEVYITSDGNNVYFRIDVYDSIIIGGYYRFFIDIDQNPGTGMSFYGIGAEYQLGLYDGYGYGMRIADGYPLSVQAAYSDSTLELSVPRSDLEDAATFDFVVFCNPSDSAYPLDTYTMTDDSTVDVDGEPSDWPEPPYVTDDVGDAVSDNLDLWGCYVGCNSTHLLAMMNTTGLISPNLYGQVFITRISDNFSTYFYGPLDVDWIVWEGSSPLSDLGFSLGDEVYVSFTLSMMEGDLLQGTYTLSPKKLLEDLKTEIKELPDKAFKSSWFRRWQKKGLCRRISSLINKVESENWLIRKLALWRLKTLNWKIKKLTVDPWETDLIGRVDTILELVESLI